LLLVLLLSVYVNLFKELFLYALFKRCLLPFFRKRVQKYCFFLNLPNFSGIIFRKRRILGIRLIKIKRTGADMENMSRNGGNRQDNWQMQRRASRTRLENEREGERGAW
ncbi:MAG: hypothetical protein Q4E68_05375, partial [Prevotellaceae bacterium]|nr:hypothetical protein [Prevotellaceae bacterium]